MSDICRGIFSVLIDVWTASLCIHWCRHFLMQMTDCLEHPIKESWFIKGWEHHVDKNKSVVCACFVNQVFFMVKFKKNRREHLKMRSDVFRNPKSNKSRYFIKNKTRRWDFSSRVRGNKPRYFKLSQTLTEALSQHNI